MALGEVSFLCTIFSFLRVPKQGFYFAGRYSLLAALIGM